MSEDTTVETAETPDSPKVMTGFAVLVNENGNIFVERNPSVFSVPVDREATLIEVRRCVSEVLMDLQAQAAAEYTVIRLNQAKADPKAE